MISADEARELVNNETAKTAYFLQKQDEFDQGFIQLLEYSCEKFENWADYYYNINQKELAQKLMEKLLNLGYKVENKLTNIYDMNVLKVTW